MSQEQQHSGLNSHSLIHSILYSVRLIDGPSMGIVVELSTLKKKHMVVSALTESIIGQGTQIRLF